MHTDGLHFTVLISVHGMVAMETLSDIITLHLVETVEAYAYRWFTLHSVNKRTRHGCMETLSDIITFHLVETAEAYAYRWFTLQC